MYTVSKRERDSQKKSSSMTREALKQYFLRKLFYRILGTSDLIIVIIIIINNNTIIINFITAIVSTICLSLLELYYHHYVFC